ncbi:MAG: DUF368 domain-containing protein [Turicibacter sp.]|nr:DUF368 domain-containing protein [Turicibacter sp.]
MFDWFIRFVKGAVIGIGFILPGVSGGALAAVFGLYERMILFLANVTQDFKKNFLFFLPVGIGLVAGLFVISVFFSHFFEMAETQIIWFFIGCVIGTLPTLWRQSGSKGRKKVHIVTLALSTVGIIALLMFLETATGGGITLNIFTWIITGAIIAFGVAVPGLSTATLLLFLGLYAPMMSGIASLDFGVIIPIGIGGVLTIFVFAKIMAFILDRAYSHIYHVIIGLVVGSTLLIVPLDYNYLSVGGLLSAVTAILGLGFALFMGRFSTQK